MPATSPASPPRPRRRLRLRYFALGLVAVIPAYALWGWWKVERRLAAIRAAGDPVTLADIRPEPMPAEENAAATIAAAWPLLKAFDQVAYGQPHPDLLEEAAERVARGEPLTDEQSEAFATLFADHAEAVDAVRVAARQERYAYITPNLDIGMNLESGYRARIAIRILDALVNHHLARGEHDAAAAAALDGLRFARLTRDEPCVIGSLTSIAYQNIAISAMNRVMRYGQIPTAMADEVDREMDALDVDSYRIRALKQERALVLSMVAAGFGGGPPMLMKLAGPSKKQVLDQLDHQLTLAKRPWHEVSSVFEATKRDGDEWPRAIDLLLPPLESFHYAHNRATAHARCLRILNALTQAEARGETPAGLADIDLPTEATIDPFSGEPLVAERRGETATHQAGWWVYSVMTNGVDDGGDFTPDAERRLLDCGLAPLLRAGEVGIE
ncbi:hypothetical protein Mal64_24630 [Pseudobythopirellula maris]|uniref:Uncharacterized protein n=1 Tax=Pseudobythopirellula maris TaxID=2527991 RepID=A0A5C5ZNA7_9BACT|nr:hypothetical protein [Pseudobythopirellula maris]TWT88972.1 hypothetical protein Mal64_24630 [Pseudobythopirellula maris]